MAVRLEGTIRRYLGLSTDTKPKVGEQFDGAEVTARELPAGSSFLETDTGRILRWDGEAWTYPSAGAEVTEDYQAALLAEALKQTELLEQLLVHLAS